MKRYNVTVNGNLYQVEVDEVIGEFKVPVESKAVPTPISATSTLETIPQQARPSQEETAHINSNIAGECVNAPMPGTIVKVVATKGTIVKKGDVLFVLEAMKMENEIMAALDGTVVEVAVEQGGSVSTGDLLAVIR